MNIGRARNYVSRTEVGITLWQHPTGETYAYPVNRPFVIETNGHTVNHYPDLPNLSDPRWLSRGTLPPGMPISRPTEEGYLFRFTVGGISVLGSREVVIRYS